MWKTLKEYIIIIIRRRRASTRRTRKLMTKHKALNPRDDVDRLYVSRKEGWRWLVSIEDSVDASTQRFKVYMEKQGGLITATRNDTAITKTNRMTMTRKQNWERKQLYKRFKRLISNISHGRTWAWLRKGNFKTEIAAQNNAVRTNHIKARIDKTQ